MRFDNAHTLLAKYNGKNVLIDTNLLVLLLVGFVDPAYIRVFEKTQSYYVEDFELLRRILRGFKKIIVTPNILTEVSNLVNRVDIKRKKILWEYLHKIITEQAVEIYVNSESVLNVEHSFKFGLTDIGISMINEKDTLVLTADFDLWGLLQSKNIDTLNFNHVRPYNWKK